MYICLKGLLLFTILISIANLIGVMVDGGCCYLPLPATFPVADCRFLKCGVYSILISL